jgi:hypothetical protein
MVEVVSAKIDEETRRRMRRLTDVNWSEVMREAIHRKIEEEEKRRTPVDRERRLRAAARTDAIRTPATPGWDSTEEIRKWREARH